MEPKDVILWATCLGVAWLIFASLTDADEWLKSLFGKSRTQGLEARVDELEKRLETLEKK